LCIAAALPGPPIVSISLMSCWIPFAPTVARAGLAKMDMNFCSGIEQRLHPVGDQRGGPLRHQAREPIVAQFR
jgi:hypothetical protein